MHVITRRRLREFYDRHKDAREPLEAWYRIVRETRYSSLAELRRTFPSADLVGNCTVFNIGGNKYRLITAIHYKTGKVFIRFVLTHKEYDKGAWKKDCGYD